MMIMQAASGFTLGLDDLLKLLGIAVVAGGLMMQMKYHGKRLDAFEKHYEDQRKEDQKALAQVLTRIESRAAERTAALEERHNKLEERFLGAIERLGESMSSLTTRLETVVGIAEQRRKSGVEPGCERQQQHILVKRGELEKRRDTIELGRFQLFAHARAYPLVIRSRPSRRRRRHELQPLRGADRPILFEVAGPRLVNRPGKAPRPGIAQRGDVIP